jgi:YD repeat-containing protein
VSSFGTSGITLTPIGGAVFNNAGGVSAVANAMTVESSGNILVSGYGTQHYRDQYGTLQEVQVLTLAQYTSSGKLDQTFGAGGVLTPPTGEFSSAAMAEAILSGGNLVVTGEVAPQYGSASMFVAEYTMSPTTSTYTYNPQNQLATYTLNGTNTSYLYDDDGDRVEETVNGTATYYLIDTNNPTGYDQPIEQKASPTATPSETYIIGDRVLGQADGSGTLTWLLVDGHGSTRLLTNASGTVTATLNYDASGNALNFNPATIGTIWQFGGDGYYDYASGLTFHSNGRQSDSLIGRFITEDDEVYVIQLDPITGNLYILDNANPGNVTDPSGHSGIDSWENEGGALGEVYGIEEDIAAQQVDNLGLENLDDMNASTAGLNQQFSNVLQDVVTNAEEAELRLVGISPVSLGEQELAEQTLLEDPELTITEKSLQNDFADIGNKIQHIFGNTGKNWGPLLNAFGGNQQEAVIALQEAGREAVAQQGIQEGVQVLRVVVQGVEVTVKGIVRNGVFSLGTAW